MLCKVILTFESVGETLTFKRTSYWAVLSFGAVHYAVQGGSNFGWNPTAWLFNEKGDWAVQCFGTVYYAVQGSDWVVLTFRSGWLFKRKSYWERLTFAMVCYTMQRGSQFCRSVDEILNCDHSNESYWTVLSCGAVYYAVQDESVDEMNSLSVTSADKSYWVVFSFGTV